jgi:nucleotide-binding universal stress UspA family protein
MKKIIVPLDGSVLAEKALPHAEELARRFEADLILVWVLHPLLVMSDYGEHSYEQLITLEEQEARSYLTAKQIEFQKHDLPVQTKIMEGQPAQAIIDLACNEEADLIVMCTHGRSGLSRWVHGSVATKVLQHAPCPIFLVRSREPECD